jgi:hypothetical protein
MSSYGRPMPRLDRGPGNRPGRRAASAALQPSGNDFTHRFPLIFPSETSQRSRGWHPPDSAGHVKKVGHVPFPTSSKAAISPACPLLTYNEGLAATGGAD